jgi:beta-glucosidase-like glycosyl hydrolase
MAEVCLYGTPACRERPICLLSDPMRHRIRALAAAALIAFLALARAAAESGYVDKLAAAGSLGVPLAEARAIESKLGQLFVVNVDGFGYSGPLALAPGYVALVKRLQVGGVIPHYGSTDIERIRRTNRALSAMTREPLMICCDIVKLSEAPTGKAGRTARFGDGYVGGFIGRFRGLSDPNYRSLASLNAFVLSALGINVALGPTVDDSTSDPRTAARARVMIAELRRFGLEPVIKHFPLLPRSANLHRESPDTKVALRVVEKRTAIFRELSGMSDILMTTHLRDSLVDSRIVTFSPRWIDILRRQTGFKGLLITDGLLMLSNYLTPNDPTSWALSAVLAGHDLIIVEGSAATTYRAFEGMLRVACGKTETGRLLRERIESAAARIAQFKKRNEKLLRRQVDVPPAVIGEIVSMVPTDGGDMVAFRFDPAALQLVEKDLRRSALR